MSRRRTGPLSLDSRRLQSESTLLRIVPGIGGSLDQIVEEVPRRVEETGAFFIDRGACAWTEGSAVIVAVAWTMTGGRMRSAVAKAINESVGPDARIERLVPADSEYPTDREKLGLFLELPALDSTQRCIAPEHAPALAEWLAQWLPVTQLDVWFGASRVTTSHVDEALGELLSVAPWLIVDAEVTLGAASRSGISLTPTGGLALFARGPDRWTPDWRVTADALVDAALAFPVEVIRARLLPIDTVTAQPDWAGAFRNAQRPEHRQAGGAVWSSDATGSRWHGDLHDWWSDRPHRRPTAR